jgi:hypothetical protein
MCDVILIVHNKQTGSVTGLVTGVYSCNGYRAITRLVTSLVIHEACNEMDFGRASGWGIEHIV